jgi:hypothetical protein
MTHQRVCDPEGGAAFKDVRWTGIYEWGGEFCRAEPQGMRRAGVPCRSDPLDRSPGQANGKRGTAPHSTESAVAGGRFDRLRYSSPFPVSQMAEHTEEGTSLASGRKSRTPAKPCATKEVASVMN